jgi:hypothetical protein
MMREKKRILTDRDQMFETTFRTMGRLRRVTIANKNYGKYDQANMTWSRNPNDATSGE